MGLFGRFKKTASESGGSSAMKGSGKSNLLRVSDFLTENTVVFFPSGPSKRQVFGNLIGALELPDPGTALKSILAREEAGSTVIAPGIALPHARITGISSIKAALGLCPSGIHYSHAAESPVHVVMLFLGPAENMREHLAFLASVSALFQADGLVSFLLQLTTPQDVIERIKQVEKLL